MNIKLDNQAPLTQTLPWHSLSIEEVLSRLRSSTQGLVEKDALVRQMHAGRNQLPRVKRSSIWTLVLRQLSSTLIVILLAASVISYFIGEPIDALFILGAVLINVIVGFVQEFKAESALEELRRFVQHFAHVWRDGRLVTIKVEDLVVGDVYQIKAGDRVPADSRLIQVHELEINESPLTGESQPVKKHLDVIPADVVVAERNNMAYLGSSIAGGDGVACVVAIGQQTELGKIASLLQEVSDEPTQLQLKLARFARLNGLFVFGACLVVLVLGVSLGYEFRSMFVVSVAMAVSAVPEGLVVAVTAILAMGMRRILKKQALVRKLVAAETLGTTTVVCVDKTGTLTKGEMALTQIILPDENLQPKVTAIYNNKNVIDLLLSAVLASEAYQEEDKTTRQEVLIGSPTEKAILQAALDSGLDIELIRQDNPRLGYVPFNSDRKYMFSWHGTANLKQIYLKGAAEKVIMVCSKLQGNTKLENLTDDIKNKFINLAEEMSSQGLRLLAVAKKNFKTEITKQTELGVAPFKEFTLLGLVVLMDPLRPEVPETIKVAQAAGVKVVMITGDHRLTAKAIADQAGLPAESANIINGDELQKMSDEELAARIENTSVFSRTTPQDKLRIVQAFKANDEVVAMTGDGVNDSPALKAADIGVALGSGSDVAREASDMVLLDNNLSTIVHAVEEGRTIFENIRKVTFYLLSDSFAEMVLLFGAFIVGLVWVEAMPLPVLATQILWINLLSDNLPSLALAMDPGDKDNMKRPPLVINSSLLDLPRKILVVLLSAVKGLVVLAVFVYLYKGGVELIEARTVAFTLLAVSAPIYIFSCKNLDKPLWHKMTLNNYWLIAASITSLLLQMAVLYIPSWQKVFGTVGLHYWYWLLIAVIIVLAMFIIELVKRYFIQARPTLSKSSPV